MLGSRLFDLSNKKWTLVAETDRLMWGKGGHLVLEEEFEGVEGGTFS